MYTKKAFIAAVFLGLAVSVNAQIYLGIKGGFNLTNISADFTEGDYDIISDPSSQYGYHFGGFVRASLLGLFIQPELLYTSIGNEYLIRNQSGSEQTASQRVGRLDIPVMAGARLGTFRLGLGPVASLVLSDNNDVVDKTGYDISLKKATFGYQLGAGVDIWKFGIDFRYEGNLSKLGDQIDIGGQTFDFDSRAKQLVFSLSFNFL